MKEQLAIRTDEPLTLAQDRGVKFQSLDDMAVFAMKVANSGLAPAQFKNSPDAILIAMQHGMEVGLSPMAALHSIAVINNRPTLYGDGLMAVALAHPLCVEIVEIFERGEGDENMVAVCVVHRKDLQPLKRTFSVADAKLANLWKKAGPWSQYPKRMLQMRARSFAIRDAFADALKGIKCAEEEMDTPPREVRGRVVETKLILPGDEPEKGGDEPCDTMKPQRAESAPTETRAASSQSSDAEAQSNPAPSATLDPSLPDLF